MKFFFIVFCLLLLTILSFYFWASSSPLKVGTSKGEIKKLQALEYDSNSKIKIMTYNMAFAHGMGSEGPGYKKESEDFYKKNLKKISEFVKENEVDILLLQEIDFNASRTYFIDEASFIAKEAGFNYVAYADSWDLNYIPFPYYPLSSQFGKMKSGGAVLSKFPITQNEVTLFSKPEENPFWYNAFYLYRYFQKVKIEIMGHQFFLGNLHTEAFKKEARIIQSKEIIKKILVSETHDEKWLLISGDFNSTRSYARQRSNFEGYPEDNYEDDPTLDLFDEGLPGLREILSKDEYLEDEESWFTFSTLKPERRLDYIYLNQEAEVLSKKRGEITVSDHYPLLLEIDLSFLLQ